MPADRGRMNRAWLVVWLASLIACALAAGISFQQSRGALGQRMDMFRASLETTRQGASVYQLKVDPKRLRFTWSPLMIAQPVFPKGPLPGKNDYRVAILAGIVLPQKQAVILRAGSDDGLRLRLDGKTLMDTWGQHPRLDLEVRPMLEPGPHLIEVDYVQMYGGQVLEVRAENAPGQSLEMHPMKPSLDTSRWQALLDREATSKKWFKFLLALLAGLALLPLAWRLTRDGPELCKQYNARWGGLAKFVGAGILLLLAAQGLYYLLRSDQLFIRHLIIYPLAGGVAGAGLYFLARRMGLWRYGDYWPRLRDWYLAREAWLLPCLAFAGLFVFWYGLLYVKTGQSMAHLKGAPFDAHWYRHLTAHGYMISRHDSGVLYDTGNYAWFPLLPLISSLWYKLGLDRYWSCLLTAWLGALGAFHLLFRVARRISGLPAARWSLAALACWPTSFYLLIAFPYGLGIALSAGYFLALDQRRFLLAGLLGLGLGMSYPSAVAAGVIPLFMLLPQIHRAKNPWPELRGLVISSALLLAGFLVIFIHHWISFDDFWLPLSAQTKWGRHWAWPWQTIWHSLANFQDLEVHNAALVFLIMMLLAFGQRLKSALWAFLAVTLILSTTSGTLLCNYRQYLMAWPLFLLVGVSRRPAWLKASFMWVGLYLGAWLYLPLWLAQKLP